MIAFAVLLIIWLAYWSAESGASLPWSKSWQDKKPWFSEVPEAIVGLTIGCVGIWGWTKLFDIAGLAVVALWVIFIAVSYLGKQSGTKPYLKWEKNTDSNAKKPDSTLTIIADPIARQFGFTWRDEAYSWTWAILKGFITTFPVGGLGGLFHPLCREAASHAKGRLPGDPNKYMELADGVAYALACIAFILIVNGAEAFFRL